uniref:Uncharacterized protein n=2 Tax=Oryza sativa subsp. japonica TaxID=39947 RepID=Q8W2T9_ORYSJ|nr:hypothetical protein [Oryza sativa Japonica Group]AAP53335.1 hypothetical protein LOC_Os10g22060 [Oryza sativa Japonica Group]
MGAEVPDLPAAIELGEVIAAGQLFSTNRRPSTNQQPPPVSFARRRTGEMGKREENVELFLGRREYRLGTIFVPALKNEGHVLSGFVVQGNLFKFDVKVAAMAVRLKGLIWCTLTPKISMGTWLNMKVMPISVSLEIYNLKSSVLCLAGCARLVSTQVNNTTAIFSNISFSSFKEKQMCRKIVSKLVSLSSGISESMTGHHAIRALLAWLCSAHHCHALHFLLSANPFWICLSSNPERTIAFS